MVMLEEFRRRKKLKDYFDLMNVREREKQAESGQPRTLEQD